MKIRYYQYNTLTVYCQLSTLYAKELDLFKTNNNTIPKFALVDLIPL